MKASRCANDNAQNVDKIPIYNLTHAIRLLIVQRCETTLSWDQLRSPQVSQFLVKPIQQVIMSSHFTRATIFVLIANCLQFHKEAQMHPANSGVSKARGIICELLAVRLLKEYTTRELIDALNYEFDPLQGLNSNNTASTTPGIDTPLLTKSKYFARAARISTVEVAIRAQAKKFLSHPVVVQQLEAIWAGTIAFQSAADELHRRKVKAAYVEQGHGTVDRSSFFANMGWKFSLSRKSYSNDAPGNLTVKRAVTLYDPREATPFKLSRLRVPRYRAIFTTISFAIMLGLFLAVLIEKSLSISFLEVLFWFWSAGYMLDEVVGFTVQGFGLYFMSFWNAFDIGILMLFVAYYVLRLIGILTSITQSHYIASMAYDVLAATAVLLFPRLFSVLDHYKYFSQLLIAFRMMAMDLIAVLVLIIIACSGFLVAFTLSFGDDEFDAAAAAYALFQMLMGFTPAAWEVWDSYNPLGKAILVLFLFICHFLVVTILITVLTNSFMAVVANANEEHQFLFAINTISMVKSDALFSYMPPTNIIGWLLIPTRYFIPFRQFVKLNRIVIKITHLPILFLIFFYERFILSYQTYDLADLVEQQGRGRKTGPAFAQNGGAPLFSPGRKIREPSVATFRKDLVLNEVFRQPYRSSTRQSRKNTAEGKRKSLDAVQDWMSVMGHEGGAVPPVETPRSVLDRLESGRSRARHRGSSSGMRSRRRQFSMASKSIASDPEDITSYFGGIRPKPIPEEALSHDIHEDEFPQATDADGDDELVTNDEEDKADRSSILPQKRNYGKKGGISNEIRPGQRVNENDDDDDNGDDDNDDDDDDDGEDYHRTPKATTFNQRPSSSSAPFVNRSRAAKPAINLSAPMASSPPVLQSPKPRIRAHNRNRSTNTILYSPVQKKTKPSPTTGSHSISPPRRRNLLSQHQNLLRHADDLITTANHGTSTGRRTPRRSGGQSTPHLQQQQRPTRAIPIPRRENIGTILGLESAPHRYEHPSLSARALDLASDLGDNRHGPDPGSAAILLPASLATEMGFAERRAAAAAVSVAAHANANANVNAASVAAAASAVAGRDDVSRKVLARIGNLERSFRNIVKEVKDWRKEGGGLGGSAASGSGNASRVVSDGDGDAEGGSDGRVIGAGAKRVRGKDRIGKSLGHGRSVAAAAVAGAEYQRPASENQRDEQFQDGMSAENAALASSSL